MRMKRELHACTGDVFEIGWRFPHEIEVAGSPDGTDSVHYVYVASVDSHDSEVAPGSER